MKQQKIELTLDDLRDLLDKQRNITIEKCLRNSSSYNKESTPGSLKSLPIDEDKFWENGLYAHYPDDYIILKKYLGNS
jgi:hypothetical protein